MSKRKAEWHGRSDFAEIAETLSLNTDQIFAAYPLNRNTVYVFYTPGEEGDDTVYLVSLVRGEDGILRHGSMPMLQPNFFEDMQAKIAERLNEVLGPPPPEEDA